MALEPGLTDWLRLCHVSGLGSEGLRKLLQAFGSPTAVLQQSVYSLSHYVKQPVARAIGEELDEAAIAQAANWLDDPLNRILTIADDDFPQALLNIPDPPLLLYVKGRLDLLNRPSLAIVGSRNATAQGIRNAEAFARAASESGLCIISGLAQGIDAAAHRGGLQAAGASLAVVGTGLDKVYPASNRELAHALAQQGCIISEFPLGTPPLPANFPRRNRIISGLSLGCLVVEAGLQSGSLITARMALEQGRDVFAIPGSIHSPQSKGCHSLIKQGAKLVEGAQDILEELGYHPKAAVTSQPLQHSLFNYLGFDPVDGETLAQRSGLTISELSAILLQLELEGAITTLPGGRYQRIN
ncbi:DNA-processing protein DprA [Ferrigenium sp. UT5]|uniref:DNA-processing protein DprA n=1 Tax=Ferrigenium sp. UT5 TaxID=3242105 RepID=UPI00354BD1C2